jgi:hypothetical protein
VPGRKLGHAVLVQPQLVPRDLSDFIITILIESSSKHLMISYLVC